MNQLHLLPSRRFGPLFWAQFLGAFNDNLFKSALVILITFKAVSLWGVAAEHLVALCAGVFILPFFLLSATAGQLADKYAKSSLMKWTKLAEVAVMGVAAAGFLTGNIGVLLGVLFLMGVQSTFFGPAKYSVLPELLSEDDLVGGNALLETGSFLAILLGTIAGGLLIAMDSQGASALAGIGMIVAIAGWLTSLWIPVTPRNTPNLEVNFNPVVPTLQTFRVVGENRAVFLSILAISWFWFIGASLLTLLPGYTKSVLFADESVVTLLLCLLCIGMAVGALLCERMSDRKLELGLVPFGSIGMTLFILDLSLAGNPYAGAVQPMRLLSLNEFLIAPGSIRIIADIVLLAIFSGFYTVPLYTMIQQRSEHHIRARIIAGNNILNALFMVGSSALLIGLFALDLTFAQISAILALANALVAVYIYTVIPEFLLRFSAWILASMMYRVQVSGRDNIPLTGPALLVCNHVTFIDWLIIASACKRPVRFVMYHKFFNIPVVGFLFRDAKVIPIAPAHEDGETLEAAFDRIADELNDGEIVCIFPEGKLTKDGKLNEFRTGVERIVARTPVPVVPMALVGLWKSFFSRYSGSRCPRPFRRWWSTVALRIGVSVDPEDATAPLLATKVAALAGLQAPA